MNGTFHQVCLIFFGTHNYEHCVTVYNTRGYLDNVDNCAKLSMLSAIDEVKALPDYMQSGEVINCNVCFCFKRLYFINSG